MAVAEFGSITGYFKRGKSGQTRILAIGEVGDKTGGDRPREHCNCIRILKYVDFLFDSIEHQPER